MLLWNVTATTLLIFSRCNVDTSGASYTGAAAVYFMSANVRSISFSAFIRSKFDFYFVSFINDISSILFGLCSIGSGFRKSRTN